jgi:rubredoxin
LSEPAAPPAPLPDAERYPGETHWYDLPDDDATPEGVDPTDPAEAEAIS